MKCSPFLMRRAALREAELEAGREFDPDNRNVLDNFEFTADALEAHSVHVTVEVENRPPFELLTYKEDSPLPGELTAAHRVALRRWVLGLRPATVIDARAFLRRGDGRDVEADASDARAIVARRRGPSRGRAFERRGFRPSPSRRDPRTPPSRRRRDAVPRRRR